VLFDAIKAILKVDIIFIIITVILLILIPIIITIYNHIKNKKDM
jgi:hypothetical protein